MTSCLIVTWCRQSGSSWGLIFRVLKRESSIRFPGWNGWCTRCCDQHVSICTVDDEMHIGIGFTARPFFSTSGFPLKSLFENSGEISRALEKANYGGDKGLHLSYTRQKQLRVLDVKHWNYCASFCRTAKSSPMASAVSFTDFTCCAHRWASCIQTMLTTMSISASQKAPL